MSAGQAVAVAVTFVWLASFYCPSNEMAVWVL